MFLFLKSAHLWHSSFSIVEDWREQIRNQQFVKVISNWWQNCGTRAGVYYIINFENQYSKYGKDADLFGGLKNSVEMRLELGQVLHLELKCRWRSCGQYQCQLVTLELQCLCQSLGCGAAVSLSVTEAWGCGAAKPSQTVGMTGSLGLAS